MMAMIRNEQAERYAGKHQDQDTNRDGTSAQHRRGCHRRIVNLADPAAGLRADIASSAVGTAVLSRQGGRAAYLAEP